MWLFFFFFKQKTAYELRISVWSSDVCSSDLDRAAEAAPAIAGDSGNRDRPAGPVVLAVEVAVAFQLDEVRTDIIPPPTVQPKIGRASCRERVCQYVSISVVAVSLKKKNINNRPN